MRTKLVLSACVTAGFALTGCGDKDPGRQAQTTSTSVSSGSADETGGGDSMTTSPDDGADDGQDSGSADETGGDDSGPTSDPSGGFIDPNDGGTPSFECDPWTQDCPDAQKCMPWANDGGNSWNATKCTPLDPNPAQVGDECTVEGTGISGVDNCEKASLCWAVDPETGVGNCVAFCSGTEANPSCDDPSTSCSITNSGSLILCLPVCDPLTQNCPDGQACYGVASAFICAPNASQPDQGNYGDPCEYINVCNPGLFCASAGGVPGCTASCCSEFCDVSLGSSQCSGASAGQECVPWFEMGAAPPGFEDVGGCSIPS